MEGRQVVCRVPPQQRQRCSACVLRFGRIRGRGRPHCGRQKIYRTQPNFGEFLTHQLLGFFFAVKAWSYGLDRYLLLYGDNGVVIGAGYTDVHVELPVLWLLIGLSIVAAFAAWANLRVRTYRLPAGAVVLVNDDPSEVLSELTMLKSNLLWPSCALTS